MKKDRVQSLIIKLSGQKSTFTKRKIQTVNAVRASCVVSELILKNLKPFSDGEFVEKMSQLFVFPHHTFG